METTITLNESQRRLLLELLNRAPLRGNEAGAFVGLLAIIANARPTAKTAPELRIDHDKNAAE